MVPNNGFDHITDRELLERFYDDHNNDWLGVLLSRYTLLLLGVCMKYLKNEDEAKDAVQQVFLKAITELHKYKVEYFKSWIYMVAKNHCLMLLRARNGRHGIALSDNLQELTTHDDEAGQLHEKEELLNMVSGALGQLNNDQQRCVTLFYLEKESYQDIARKTGFSMMQVKSHIQNGKRNLRIMLDRKLNKEHQ